MHVAGPPGSGKTTFIEAILKSVDGPVLAARCIRDDALRQALETAPKDHPELWRYKQAGAWDAALFAFPGKLIGSEAFFVSNLMMEYSTAVLLEGDDPVGFVDLRVFVAQPRAAASVGCMAAQARGGRSSQGAFEGLLVVVMIAGGAATRAREFRSYIIAAVGVESLFQGAGPQKFKLPICL